MSVVVERARLEDAAAILALHRAVLAEREFFITLPHEFTGSIDQKIRQIRDFGRQTNSLFLVARDEARIVGFLTVQGGTLQRMRHTGKLEIMVAPDARGRGVGRMLLRACVDWAEENPQMAKLGLSVFATNDRAIRLYREHGFEEEGQRREEYRLEDGSTRDDVLMFRWTDGRTAS